MENLSKSHKTLNKNIKNMDKVEKSRKIRDNHGEKFLIKNHINYGKSHKIRENHIKFREIAENYGSMPIFDRTQHLNEFYLCDKFQQNP